MKKLKLGSIGFVNSLPVDAGLFGRQADAHIEMVRDVPARLNARLLAGELDASPVSSLFYARHWRQLKLLPDFAIGSLHDVKSVLLVSRVPIEDLDGKGIGLTAEGESTPALLKILFKKRFCIEPRYTVNAYTSDVPERWEWDAYLVIGDEALKIYCRKPANCYLYDLAGIWKNWTGLPFVFAVWALSSRSEGELERLREALAASRQWGRRNLEALVTQAAKQTGLPDALIRDYLGCLEYELSPDLESGMQKFFDYAFELKLLNEKPLADYGRVPASKIN